MRGEQSFNLFYSIGNATTTTTTTVDSAWNLWHDEVFLIISFWGGEFRY
jgi:hypothetical protein